MSIDGPFTECYAALALHSYHDARRGIVCIYKGLILVGKATTNLLVVILFLIAISYGYLITLPFRLFHWRKPNHPDILPRFEHHQKKF